jgi:peroxiredoxin
VQLQGRAGEFERAGTAIFGLSYDPVAVLADFAARHRIAFPLFADVGSRTIRRLGLLNRHLVESAALYGKGVKPHDHGLPYPGTFVLDPDGRVVSKHFEPAYRVRPSPLHLLAAVGASPPGAAVEAMAESDHVRVRAWAGQAFYHPYERIRIELEVVIAPGLHVYGRPIPPGYVPLTVELEPFDGLVVDTVRLPPPRPFRVEGLDEAFVVHKGTVRAIVDVAVHRAAGDIAIRIATRHQACSETLCHPPATVGLVLPLEGRDSVRDPA